VFKINQIKLFLLTLVGLTIIHSLYPVSAKSPEGNLYSNIKLEPKPINPDFDSQLGHLNIANESLILAKKSGGRSGGGSFKSRPSYSKSSSPNRSSNQRESISPNHNYNRRDSSTYYYGSTRQNTGISGFSNFIFGVFVLIFIAGLVFGLFYLFRPTSGSNSNSLSKAKSKTAKERNNDRVTVSLLQIVLSSDAVKIQPDLSKLSTTVDTNTDAGLVELMQESALILLRSDRYWTHVLSHSHSLNVSQAQAKFAQLSFAERGKFSCESLSNVDGKITARQSQCEDSEGFPAYLVVSLILGTADDHPLFAKIHSSENLKEVLLKLASIPEDYLMKFELLWTPQTANEYLTDEELLMEYTDVIPL
jgi:uncharacterized membrane protein